MTQHLSPLRYPGGKTAISPLVSKIISENGFFKSHYAEPFAGGAGLALSLLFQEKVHEIHLNDIDRSIWSFWDTIINHTDKFIEKLMCTPITMDEWYQQKEIQHNKSHYADFEVGFSTFFLNRTNHSGIILKAGVIGGYRQNGQYKLHCRFNKKKLIERIKQIEKYKHRIHLYKLDAVEFLQHTSTTPMGKLIYYIDPPYYLKGATLYTNFYKHKDHQMLSEKIMSLSHPWILTYDNSPEIELLYSSLRQYRFHLNYSAARKRVGTELMILSSKLKVTAEMALTTA